MSRDYISDLTTDIRYSIRALRRRPAFAAVALASLALGIGATTAIFSVLDALVIRNLPISRPEQLVVFGEDGFYSYGSYRAFTQASKHFAGLLATSEPRIAEVDLGSGEPENGAVELVTPSYFQVLGIPPSVGRLITEEASDTPGGSPIAVVSEAYWTRRLKHDAGILGTTVRINQFPFTVVGVASRGFTGLVVDSPTDIWVPLGMQRQIIPERDWLSSRPGSEEQSLRVFGRLRDGASREAAQAQLAALWVRQQIEVFGSKAASTAGRSGRQRPPMLFSAGRGVSYLRPMYTLPLYIIIATASVLLLLACVNLASLTLARAAAKRSDVALRVAFGASRGRVVRQILAEALVLSGAGMAAGLLLAHWAVPLLLRMISQNQDPVPLHAEVNWRAAAFAAGATLATTVLFGIWPALHASRVDVLESLRPVGRSSDRGRLYSGRILTAVQVSLSVVLLIGAALFVRTLWNLRHINLGFTTERLVQLTVDTRKAGYVDDAYWPFCRALVERIRAVPGVGAANLASNGVFAASDRSTSFKVPGFAPRSREDTVVNYDLVGDGYLRMLGASFLQGRDFGPEDSEGAAQTVIVNETLARYYFGDSPALGRAVNLHGVDREIVGIIRDIRDASLRRPPRRLCYVPFFQAEHDVHLARTARVLIRTVTPAESAMTDIRRALRARYPTLSISAMSPVEALIEWQLIVERMIATLSLYFGSFGVLLAMIGAYGLLSQHVTQRTREIGIRVALGAGKGTVLWTVARGTVGALVVGMGLGIGMAAGLSRFVTSLLFGVAPADLLSYATVAALLLGVAALAIYIPARRATAVHPMEALRYE